MTDSTERVDSRYLTAIEGILQGLSHKKKPELSGMQGFIPIAEVIGQYCSRGTFYNRVKDGTFKIYKLGRLSYVKASEFFAAFQQAGITKGKGVYN